MNKPVKKLPYEKKYYHWDEAKEWLNYKTGKDIDDWTGKWTGNDDAPFQSYWHFLVDHLGWRCGQIHAVDEEWLDQVEGVPTWTWEITDLILEEFGKGEAPARIAYFWVEDC